MEAIPKPDELLALHQVTAELFGTLQRWFAVPASVPLDLSAVDAAVRELGDPQMIAALAMRKLQALHLLATPGVRTSTDVVVTIVQDLERALVQAPAMRLKVAAATADWDAELAELTADADADADADPDPDPEGGLDRPSSLHPAAPSDDPELEVAAFRRNHVRLHEAVRAVLEASDGEIRYLV